jgi:NAD(P)-dependent dehydrogenase (short-subunit alcohol dehydrogenase family)
LTDTQSSRASLAPTRVEVAPIYVLLASDEASYITGQRYGVTGGEPIL